jgi:hypothetical protein
VGGNKSSAVNIVALGARNTRRIKHRTEVTKVTEGCRGVNETPL